MQPLEQYVKLGTEDLRLAAGDAVEFVRVSDRMAELWVRLSTDERLVAARALADRVAA